MVTFTEETLKLHFLCSAGFGYDVSTLLAIEVFYHNFHFTPFFYELISKTVKQNKSSPQINVYPENFPFLITGILELYTRKVCEMFVYKHIETIEYVKN